VLSSGDYEQRRDDDSESDLGEDDAETVVTTFPEIAEIFIKGYGYDLLDQLADTDIRQALKLLERVIYSDNLLGISNLTVGYHFISAAMLRRSRDFQPAGSFILNLLDDDSPDRPGNSLIRYRVLEYFVGGNRRIGDDYFYHMYFKRLGYDIEWVDGVLKLFVESGLLRSADGRGGTLDGVDSLVTTPQGWLYYHTLMKNKWYLYCIKRGMAIDEVFITRRQLRRHEYREEVEDDQLVAFLIEEENKEAVRINDFHNDVGESYDKYGAPDLVHRKVAESLGIPLKP